MAVVVAVEHIHQTVQHVEDMEELTLEDHQETHKDFATVVVMVEVVVHHLLDMLPNLD